MAGTRVEVAALVGSLRRQSYNRGLLRTAMLLQPEGMHLYEVQFDNLPFFNEDLERPSDPPAVRAFKGEIERADALLFITPEYSYSIPGGLKNALDWMSRPPGHSIARGKPAAMMGAAVGRSGTMRAQLHLRQVCVQLGIAPTPDSEVFVTFAADKFNALGELTDQTSRDLVRALLRDLMDWTERLRGWR